MPREAGPSCRPPRESGAPGVLRHLVLDVQGSLRGRTRSREVCESGRSRAGSGYLEQPGSVPRLAAKTPYHAIRFAHDPRPQERSRQRPLPWAATPTEFVIARDGKNANVSVGYEGPSTHLEQAIAALLPERSVTEASHEMTGASQVNFPTADRTTGSSVVTAHRPSVIGLQIVMLLANSRTLGYRSRRQGRNRAPGTVA